MAKFQSPLLGYNNNVRHRGRVFHIQTEDSGVNHPHIITHLFMDGGRILKSVKKSYAEHVGADNMSETVRALMKEQHKAMFIALRDGQFDALVDGAKKPSGAVVAPTAAAVGGRASAPTGSSPSANAAPAAAAASATASPVSATAATPATATPASASATPASANATPASANATPASVPARYPEASAPATPAAPDLEVAVNDVAVVSVVTLAGDRDPAAQVDDASPSPNTTPEAPRGVPTDDVAPVTIDEGRRAGASHLPLSADPPLPPEVEALLRDELPPVTNPAASGGARRDPDLEPKTAREPERRRSAQELTLDFDALERDTGASPIFQQADLPPPPKNLFAKEPRTGPYRTVDADAEHDASRPQPSRPGGPTGRPAPASAPRQVTAPPPRAPGTPTQKPASEGRYAPARPAAIFGASAKQASPSIFSDDLVSDKSLDEVILSYLAEDLDPPRRK
ncbi:MAG: hypothetical protein KF850_22910 [Labilithrix sp.]|nr:hypothetical protein [Labilithrix sp.]